MSDPDVLTYIVLKRALSVPTTIPEGVRCSGTALSDSLRSESGVSVIGEYKPTSPTRGPLTVPPEPEDIVDAYHAAGVAGMSVLTEPDLFGGGPELFSRVRAMTCLPMLYKDFVITDVQLDVAKALGADAVLLIAAALDESALDDMVGGCLARGMEPLVEVHSSNDVDKLRSLPNGDLVDMVGVNSRDLRTLRVDLGRLMTLRDSLGKRIKVAESGIASKGDIDSLRGFDAVLIGTMFMGSADVTSVVREVVSKGRGVFA